ncbi:AAA family ATPase [Myroides odoratimimus]|uniref:AAA family ATPase n=1 Tax=Myroides odoratimimus TaxID=76832 RepID=UPI002578372A|nr:ATP-binding protein [Myroides odoratimimus]MDM1511454.1 ATP-binding protein [Myroides odoratimimus]
MYIQEFSVGNFRSFKDINTLNMMATKSVSKYKEVDENNLISKKDMDVKILKTKAIYGANASGKSNIIKALSTFTNIVKDSVVQKDAFFELMPFMFSMECIEAPSFFQLIFWENGIRYRYGFEATQKEVLAEWLYHKPDKREEPLFIREGMDIVELNKTSFAEGDMLLNVLGGEDKTKKLFRENALLLTTLSSFGIAEVSAKIVKSICSIKIISGLGNRELQYKAEEGLKDEKLKSYILKLLKVGDIGIKDIFSFELTDKEELSEKNKKQLLLSTRMMYDSDGKIIEDTPSFVAFSEESEGTKKLFEMAPCIYEAFKNETPLIIDEFDARFHPMLTKEIIRLFQKNNLTSPQLVFTTHDINLLDNKMFRKDQIDFVEKNSMGASHLYSLIEFKGVRNSVSFEDEYIKGKFGAIPYLGDFNKLFDLIDDGEEN